MVEVVEYISKDGEDWRVYDVWIEDEEEPEELKKFREAIRKALTEAGYKFMRLRVLSKKDLKREKEGGK